jgi:hypothetical protein
LAADHLAANGADIGCGAKARNGRFHRAETKLDIIVEEQNELGRDLFKRQIARAQIADIAVQPDDSRTPHIMTDFSRRVGGTVIDQDQLQIAGIIATQRTQGVHGQLKFLEHHQNNGKTARPARREVDPPPGKSRKTIARSGYE